MAYDPQNLESVLSHMRQEYGPDIFRNPKRMYATFCDLASGLEPYGNVVRQFAERGGLSELEAVGADATRRDRALMKARDILENKLLLSADSAEYILGVLASLYGIAAPPSAQPGPNSPPTPQPAPPPKPKPGKIVKRGACGQYVTYTLDENGVLTISGAGLMQDFKDRIGKSDAPWWGERQNIVHVEIQDEIATIGNQAFRDCAGLTSVTIPDGVMKIGDCAFYGCAGLTNVTIPDSVTTINIGAFSSCAGLTSVTIPDGVTIIGASAFYGCAGLTSVTIPDGVTTIANWTFLNCVRIKNVTIPDSVTIIGNGAFQVCTSLTSVTIPGNVTAIEEEAFADCVRLTSVTIPDRVTTIGDKAFAGCVGLKSVSVPSKAKIAANAFPSHVKVTRR